MRAVLTGAAGFAGCNLLEVLLREGWEVFAVLREDSPHNERLSSGFFKEFEGKGLLHRVRCDMSDISALPEKIGSEADVFFNLAWHGDRNDFEEQYANVGESLTALRAAASLSCKRFIMTGSQAEYGLCKDIETEETVLCPRTAYGAAKEAALSLLRVRALQLGISFIWARLFSLYGKYEHETTLISYLIKEFKSGKSPNVSEGGNEWDYLYAEDAAEAILALALKGRDGEIYNIANGNYRPLNSFIEDVRVVISPETEINYGERAADPVELRPSVKKIFKHTLWKPKTEFVDGIRKMTEIGFGEMSE